MARPALTRPGDQRRFRGHWAKTNTQNTPVEALERAYGIRERDLEMLADAAVSLLPDKVTVRLRAGDVIRVLTPGGGGFGAYRMP